jgi:predicted phage terminase large subunit-like protein
MIGNYPELRGLIVSKTADLAEATVGTVRKRIESDPRYHDVFGNLKPEAPQKWTDSEFFVDRKTISKFPTLRGVGLGGSLTGYGFDYIIADDIIDEENVRTTLQFERADTWFFKVLLPTLFPWGGTFVLGTRWHYADLYGSLIASESEGGKNWQYKIYKAIQNPNEIEAGAQPLVLWPQVWSYKRLMQKKKEVGSIVFSCQYQNDPTAMEGNLLKASWLHAWNESNPNFNPPPNLPIYAGIDPSLGESDYFGIATLAYDARINQAYLLDVWAEHMPFPTIIKQVFPQLNSKYHYQKVFMETNFWQKLLTKMPELQGYPIVPVQTVKNKEERFIPMSSHFESKRVLVNPLLLNHSEFWTEWVQFPRGQHDDAVDCVELVVSKIVGSGPKANPSFLLG